MDMCWNGQGTRVSVLCTTTPTILLSKQNSTLSTPQNSEWQNSPVGFLIVQDLGASIKVTNKERNWDFLNPKPVISQKWGNKTFSFLKKKKENLEHK